MQDFKFDYFYGSQAEQFSFFRLPKILIRDARFKKISSDAKILYGIMLDRMSLSRENKWMDQNNRVYIIFTLKEVMKEFECCQRKAGSLMAELDSKSGVGLIERKRQGGLDLPEKFYCSAGGYFAERGEAGAGRGSAIAEWQGNATYNRCRGFFPNR